MVLLVATCAEHSEAARLRTTIGVPAKPWPAGEWRRLLAGAVTEAAELLGLLGLDDRVPPATPDAVHRFPLRVPRGFIARMRRGDPLTPPDARLAGVDNSVDTLVELSELLRELAGRLPGYLLPLLVRELPGAPFKLAVDLKV